MASSPFYIAMLIMSIAIAATEAGSAWAGFSARVRSSRLIAGLMGPLLPVLPAVSDGKAFLRAYEVSLEDSVRGSVWLSSADSDSDGEGQGRRRQGGVVSAQWLHLRRAGDTPALLADLEAGKVSFLLIGGAQATATLRTSPYDTLKGRGGGKWVRLTAPPPAPGVTVAPPLASSGGLPPEGVLAPGVCVIAFGY